MTRFLHDDCEHCRHPRIVITSECPNFGCRKPIEWDYVDVFEHRGKCECPHCGVPIIYTMKNGVPTIEGDAERLDAMTRPQQWRLHFADRSAVIGACACGEIETMAGQFASKGKIHSLRGCAPIA